MDPMRFLTSEDDVERLMMEGIADRAREARERRDSNLAVQIANAIGKAQGGKK